MSLLFSLLMKMDAGSAKAELRALQKELAKGKAEVDGLGAAAAAADDKVDGLGAASGRAAAQNDKMAQSSDRVKTASQGAAGSVGNLVANFNDIGVMIAAGQSPLQLAIQQGTQITQVIGPMGAAGAASALGGALVSMLSPFNLLTLGAIAFGTAAIQWLMGGEDAALSLTDALEGSATAIGELRKVGQVDLASLRKDFGAVTSDVVEMQEALTKLASVKAIQAQQAAVAALKAETEGSWWAAFTDQRFTQGGQIAGILGTDWLVRGKLVATKEVAAFRKSLESLETARGPRAQLEIFESLQEQMIVATGGIDQMTASQMAFYEGLVQSEQQIRLNIQAQREALLAAQEQQRAAGDKEDGRMGGPLAIDLTGGGPSTQENDVVTARELLSTLQEQANVQDLINQYGSESATVALARVEAERAAFVEMTDGLAISESLKDEMIAVWDAANGVASARIAAMIEQALGPASSLNGLLKSAAGWWSTIKSNMAIARFNRDSLVGSQVYSGRGGDPRDFMPGGSKSSGNGVSEFVYDGPSLDRFNNPISTGGTGRGRGGGGGGAKAAREEKDAVAELIKKLREEQETLQETDPVKREMLKYRKQLAEATTAEKAEVEGLIQAEMRLKAVQAAREYASDAVGDFLEQIIAKGGKASDVLRGLAAQFLSMAARSVISGQGWFANLLGISGGLFGGGKAAAAVPAIGRVSAGYQPVQARAGASNPLPASQARLGSAASTGAPIITVHVHGATGNSEIQEMTERGITIAMQHYDRHVLPSRLNEIQQDPRKR